MDPRIATKKWLLTVERIERKIDRLLAVLDREGPGDAPIGAGEPGVPDLSPAPAQKRPKAAVTGG